MKEGVAADPVPSAPSISRGSRRKRRLSRNCWVCMEERSAAVDAPPWRQLALVLLVLIVVSCVAFTLQTVNVFYAGDQAVWVAIETVCIIAFTIEYLCRFACAPDRSQFVKGGLNVIDLVAILPFYVEHMLSGTEVAGLGVFRIVRLARVFRLFKLGRYSDGLKTFATTMRQSTRPLAMLLFFMVIAIVLFSSAIYYAERGTWDEVRRQWWRDGNLGRTQLYNQDDDRLQFYTICTGDSRLQIDNNATSSQLQITFATDEPFVGSGVAVRAIQTISWANLSFAVLNTTASAADRMANISSWANSQSWAAVDAEGASPWVGATCEAQFPLDGKVTECFGDRHTWPNTGTEAVVSWVKNTVVDHAQQMSSEGQDTRHSLEVTVSELTCEEVGCLYCTNPSPFESIPASFYRSAVTMTTVGYGDVYPVTWAGQLIACFTMMTGILVRFVLPVYHAQPAHK